jgi:dTDP-4-amino-4,6-dideoxygalactose transaminase
MGPKTEKFEEYFGQYADVPYALATSNCTTALHMALISLGIGNGDEVIVPSLTFAATSNAVLYTGAKPVFADITSLDCPLIDPKDIEKKISKKTRAIIVMHYAGYPCEMERITALAKKHGLFVIEDAAHAVGSYYDERMCGTIGDIGCYSFFANKNLPIGEGGMLVTRNRKIHEKLTRLRSHGMTSYTWDRARGKTNSYDVVELGYNYRPTEICSAIGLAQLQKLPLNNKKRDALFTEYVKALRNNNRIMLPFSRIAENGKYARHLFPIVLDENINRDTFMLKLKGFGIQTSIHYLPVHKFTYYKSILQARQAKRLNNTEAFGQRVVTLPMHPLLTTDDIGKICNCVDQALEGAGGAAVS